MKNFLSGLFGKRAAASPNASPYDRNPVAIAELSHCEDSPAGRAAAFGEAGLDAEYARFAREFYVRPGLTLMQAIAADPRAGELEPLKRWLHPSSPEAEPKAFIRLALGMVDAGLGMWEQSGIEMFLLGRWSKGGGCSDESYEALGLLVYVLRKPIKFFFQEREDLEEYRVVDFTPTQ